MLKKENVDTAIIDFCKVVIKEPLMYFSESDLHVMLMEALVNEIRSSQDLERDTNVSLGDNLHGKYKTRLIHREYGGGESKRMDIVIFNENDIKDINHPHLTRKKAKDYLEPRFAFELGICIYGAETHIKNDIDKLKENCLKDGNAVGIGYLIHIIRDETVAKEGTEKRRKKDAVIEENFKKAIKKASQGIPNNIKIIAIRLNPIRKNEKHWVRGEIFDKRKICWEKYYFEDIQDCKKIDDILQRQLK